MASLALTAKNASRSTMVTETDTLRDKVDALSPKAGPARGRPRGRGRRTTGTRRRRVGGQSAVGVWRERREAALHPRDRARRVTVARAHAPRDRALGGCVEEEQQACFTLRAERMGGAAARDAGGLRRRRRRGRRFEPCVLLDLLDEGASGRLPLRGAGAGGGLARILSRAAGRGAARSCDAFWHGRSSASGSPLLDVRSRPARAWSSPSTRPRSASAPTSSSRRIASCWGARVAEHGSVGGGAGFGRRARADAEFGCTVGLARDRGGAAASSCVENLAAPRKTVGTTSLRRRRVRTPRVSYYDWLVSWF